MTDEAARELLGAFILALDALESANANVRTLVDAHEAGQRPSEEEIREYRQDYATVREAVRVLRVLLGRLRREL